MPYAIMQQELSPVSADQLSRAFKVLPALTAIDAQNMANDAYGIIIRGLDVIDASALQDALFQEAVQTEVVDESELPVIPPAKLVKQIELLPAHLSMYDPMGRTFTLAWSDISLIAAGTVRVEEIRKARGGHDDIPHFGSALSPEAGSESRAKGSHFHLWLEIVLTGGISRYSIKADDFVFNHLVERLSPQLASNFKMLVQDLIQYAPHAGLNRGAYLVSENSDEVFTYPSKSAFFEEMTWMLWRMAQMR